ncbi:MAG: hypothetical protein M3M94_04420 [Actinomycetota bacterium]|nr:hypothetical protein [Actinomycetota bacterium]
MRTATSAFAVLAALTLSALALAAPPAPTAVTIAAGPPVVVYGANVVVSGNIVPPQGGERVDVLSQRCGASAMTRLTSVTTTPTGAWSTTVTPTANTAYQARVRKASSATVNVQVRPRIRLVKVAPRRYRARVFAGQSFAGKVAVFQRYAPALGRWFRVRAVVLAAVGTGAEPTVISGATFRSSIRRRVKVRLVLTQRQVGTCYAPGRSNVVRS